MSLIVLRASTGCDFTTVDTAADLRQFADSLHRADRHWSGCVNSWHLSTDAVAELKGWADKHGHTITTEDAR